MNENDKTLIDGGCTCREIRYRLNRDPMVVHCCHCRWCQRETGAAFALNAMIESINVEILSGKPERIETPSHSGHGQTIVRCPNCKIAVWSHYAGAGDILSFIRVGSLDEPDAFSPDIHIYTASKQPWVILPTDKPAFEEFYRRSEQLSEDALERLSKLTAK